MAKHVAVVNGTEVTLTAGNVLVGGKVVGHITQTNRYGYHPSIRVDVGSREAWVELDTPNLLDVCCKTVVDLL